MKAVTVVEHMTSYVPDRGYVCKTLLVAEYFDPSFETLYPASARLYVRQQNKLQIVPVTGLSRDRVTDQIYGETVRFERVALNPDDFLYVEMTKR